MVQVVFRRRGTIVLLKIMSSSDLATGRFTWTNFWGTWATSLPDDWLQKGALTCNNLETGSTPLNSSYLKWASMVPDVQAGFRKGRGTRDQIANILWILKKAREFQETSTLALLTTPKPLTVWITTNCGKFSKRWEYQTT